LVYQLAKLRLVLHADQNGWPSTIKSFESKKSLVQTLYSPARTSETQFRVHRIIANNPTVDPKEAY